MVIILQICICNISLYITNIFPKSIIFLVNMYLFISPLIVIEASGFSLDFLKSDSSFVYIV